MKKLRFATLRRFCIVLTVVLFLSASATGLAGTLEREVERVANQGARRHAEVGVVVVAVRSGRIIYRRRAMDKLIAASNEKIVTAAIALEVLGPNYEFVTQLLADGPVHDGTLRGDLVVRGGGDPTIGGRHEDQTALDVLRGLARRIRQRGITRVTGDVVVDCSFFDRQWYHPDWPVRQVWKWYFPPACALSVNDNCVVLDVKPGSAPASAARVSVQPAVAPVRVDNDCTTAARRHVIHISRSPSSSVITVGGSVRQGSVGYSDYVTVPDPPLYAARVAKQALEAEGVRVDGLPRILRGAAPGGLSVLCERRTPLLPVLERMLKESHNHYAEQVLKTVGAENAGDGSWAAGTRRAARMLNQMGFRDSEFNLADGSGLSRNNRLPPALLTAVLMKMFNGEHGDTFPRLLAVAGWDGTLQKRLTEAPYAGNVRAKTGYLNGVGALSGYATTRSGIEVAFSILVNDEHNPPGTFSMRQTVDPICRAIIDHAQ